MTKHYEIAAVENGYVILHPGVEHKKWVARSWAEVLEILTEIGAPDFVPEIKKSET